MSVKLASLCLVGALIAVSGCNQKSGPVAAAAPAKPKIGIHPFGTGDPNFKPDYSKLPPDLQKVFTYIDANIDDHAENIQKWIQQPSISNSGEGIPESAEMVKGFFEKLGCQNARVYDVGTDRIRQPGQSRRLRQVRRGRAEDGRHLLAVRHDAGDAAGRLDCSAVRGEDRGRRDGGRRWRVARDHRPRRHQLQGPRDGGAERHRRR